MSTKEQYWKYSLITIIIGLGIILFLQITPFLGGLLGALTIYILVRRQMIHLTDKRKMKRSVAATLITTEAILLLSGSFGTGSLAIGQQIAGYQPRPAKYYCPD